MFNGLQQQRLGPQGLQIQLPRRCPLASHRLEQLPGGRVGGRALGVDGKRGQAVFELDFQHLGQDLLDAVADLGVRMPEGGHQGRLDGRSQGGEASSGLLADGKRAVGQIFDQPRDRLQIDHRGRPVGAGRPGSGLRGDRRSTRCGQQPHGPQDPPADRQEGAENAADRRKTSHTRKIAAGHKERGPQPPEGEGPVPTPVILPEPGRIRPATGRRAVPFSALPGTGNPVAPVVTTPLEGYVRPVAGSPAAGYNTRHMGFAAACSHLPAKEPSFGPPRNAYRAERIT